MTITLDKTGQTESQTMTLEEFLSFDDGTDALYEFEDGELILMTAESEINRRITSFLFAWFLQQGIPAYRLSMKTEIIVTGSRVRVPDLVVFSEELAIAMEGAKRSTVTPEMPAPLLAIEVVSPNQASRDYRYKRSEYAARDITEYWIVDPIEQKVTVLVWVEGFYDEQIYQGDMAIASPIFTDIKLTAAQVLQA
ncbi:Uma2 family endonuclease [Cronbergia sp. UHCC 0137]|uniref:Uma2 family endonuclease n=1 Tax=Cronbergia sp. UHCC 0137 TaxID=3110239 RepID=UPI002B1F1777|nr:Uma2 family endonuclease [Cronbergia sp. UHCC 0137]MEA5618967.1 Uma2 family endonuclease [Cronbergia sp. UHCC 0137]